MLCDSKVELDAAAKFEILQALYAYTCVPVQDWHPNIQVILGEIETSVDAMFRLDLILSEAPDQEDTS